MVVDVEDICSISGIMTEEVGNGILNFVGQEWKLRDTMCGVD